MGLVDKFELDAKLNKMLDELDHWQAQEEIARIQVSSLRKRIKRLQFQLSCLGEGQLLLKDEKGEPISKGEVTL